MCKNVKPKKEGEKVSKYIKEGVENNWEDVERGRDWRLCADVRPTRATTTTMDSIQHLMVDFASLWVVLPVRLSAHTALRSKSRQDGHRLCFGRRQAVVLGRNLLFDQVQVHEPIQWLLLEGHQRRGGL